MNILITSDWHRGPEEALPPNLAQLIRHIREKLDNGWKVVLAGDIFDALEYGWPAFNNDPLVGVIRGLIAGGAILLEGNHDSKSPYFPQLKNFFIDGIYISHWDEFDLVWGWLPISRFPVPDCIRKWYRTPRKLKEGNLQDWHVSTAACEYRATQFAAKHGYKAIIGGHTHSGVVINREGLIVANSSDFVDSCRWLEYV
ncbi:hypothetical protein ES703_32588 [subsurface metagenome]